MPKKKAAKRGRKPILAITPKAVVKMLGEVMEHIEQAESDADDCFNDAEEAVTEADRAQYAADEARDQAQAAADNAARVNDELLKIREKVRAVLNLINNMRKGGKA